MCLPPQLPVCLPPQLPVCTALPKLKRRAWVIHMLEFSSGFSQLYATLSDYLSRPNIAECSPSKYFYKFSANFIWSLTGSASGPTSFPGPLHLPLRTRLQVDKFWLWIIKTTQWIIQANWHPRACWRLYLLQLKSKPSCRSWLCRYIYQNDLWHTLN